MKVDKARGNYYESSGTASELTRKLGFAGLAAIWLFTDSARTASQNIADLSGWLLVSGAGFVAALGLDLFHYAAASAMYSGRVRYEEKDVRKKAKDALEEKRKAGPVTKQDKIDAENASHLSDDAEISMPGWINWPALTFFWLKQAAVVFGYIALFVAILQITPAAGGSP